MINKKDKGIHFIITGGTIDSFYDGSKDSIVPSKKSVIPELIHSFKLDGQIRYTHVCMKDSRALDDRDLKNIINTISKRIIKL